MKKVILLLIVLVLFGCGKKDSSKVTCAYDADGITSTLVYYYKDVEVTGSVEKIHVDYAAYGVKAGTSEADDYKAYLENIYSGYDGIESKVEMDDSGFIIELNINYREVSYDNLVELGLMDNDKATMIGIQESVDASEASGYTCDYKK